MSIVAVRKLNHIAYQGNEYEIPNEYKLEHCNVELIDDGEKIKIYKLITNEFICEHEKIAGQGRVLSSHTTNRSDDIIYRKQIDNFFGNDRTKNKFIDNTIRQGNPEYLISQLRRLARMTRFYDKNELIEGMKYCIKRNKCSIFELSSYLIYLFGRDRARVYLHDLELGHFTKRAKAIKEEVERNGISSPGGSKKWSVTTIKSILTNEKFKGDVLLQKQYTADFLTKKRIDNKGEIPQYYVSDDHEAIIDKKTFDAIQVDIPKRCGKSGNNLFLNKVVCGECGSVFGRKLWHSNDKYRKYVLRCNAKYKNDCNSGSVTEEEVKDFFIACFNKLNKKECLKDIELMKEALGDLTKENNEIEKIHNDILKIVT